MHKFERLYVDQVNLLKEKGYDTLGLNSHDASVEFLGALLVKFLEAYQKSERTNEPSLFYVSNRGFFNNNQDEVKIVFNYKYDPEKAELLIGNLYVTMNGLREPFYLKTNEELPSPDTVYRNMIAAYDLTPEKKMDDFWQAFEQHKNFLIEKGFDENGLNNGESVEKYGDRVLDAFKTGLLQNLSTSDIPFSISVETVGHFNENRDTVTFQFNYVYDPDTVSLRLSSLRSSMDESIDESNVYVVNKENELPNSQMIHNYFSEKQQLVKQIVPALRERYCAPKRASRRLQ